MILVADPPAPLVTDAFVLTPLSPDLDSARAFGYVLCDPTDRRALGGLCLDPLFPYLSAKGASAKTLNTYAGGVAARVTIWLRGPGGGPMMAVLDEWLRTKWSLDSYVYRALPSDHATVEALNLLPLKQVILDLPAEQIPYVWWSRPDNRDT